MSDTIAALAAAGIVYDLSDFADPHLDGPTALTVTADGRVFGHLAAWDTPHIGLGRHVVPPKSPTGYKFFHQGVVPTGEGDLPVGKLTLGTGHAPVDGRTDAVAAAAHYDDTGMVAAVVRAGEDKHGIWLAGRIVPGTAPERVDELRRSGVSGDWRGIDGAMELVAALAVNVPGFPIPRTEELVAGGAPMALVAAGVVSQVAPPTPDEVEAMVASAVKSGLQQIRAAERRRNAVVARVEGITASVYADRRAAITARVSAALTAAGGGRRVRTQEGATRFGVSVGDLIPEAVEQAQQLAGNFAEAAGNDLARAVDPKRNTPAKKPVPAPSEADEPAVGKETSNAPTEPPAKLPPKTGEKVKVGDSTSTPKPSSPPAPKPDPPDGPPKKEDADPVAKSDIPQVKGDVRREIPADAPPPRIDAGAGADHLMEEDETPYTGAFGGKMVDFSRGVAVYDDDSWTDGTEWHVGSPPDTFAPEDGLDPDVDDFGEDAATPVPGEPVTDTDVPPRVDVGAGDDHPMEEDEIPLTGAYGGQFTEFSGGVAFFDDGTDTDGKTWRHSEPYEDPDALAASAAAHARMMRALGYTVPNRRRGGAYPKA